MSRASASFFRREPCPHHAMHWFAYYGCVGSSSPRCVRSGCNALNPNYDPDRDPKAFDAALEDRHDFESRLP